MKLGILFSGGKDSTYAMYLASQNNKDKVVCLITIHSDNKESYMFHTPSISKTEKQAEVLNLPLMIWKTMGEKEKELKDLEDAIKEAKKKYHIEGIVTGALASEYQASRIGNICDKLGLKCINPLWKKNQEDYWDELLKENFKIMIIGVACDGLRKEWLGKIIDKNSLVELKKLSRKYKFNTAFEGGEAETFVLDCPLFGKALRVDRAETFWDGSSGSYEIKKIEFVDKN